LLAPNDLAPPSSNIARRRFRLAIRRHRDAAQASRPRRIADVFLDTLPYRAHCAAADTLWADVPV
jgi:predicted O-linked N-acetylglucosamine transferase (SPINDLY family)